MKQKILLVRKMSALEYHYKMTHASKELKESHEENNASVKKIEEILKKHGTEYDLVTREVLPQTRFEDYSRVISAGGDGTVIAVAAYNQNTPQLNLRTDKKSKGVLCQDNLERGLETMLEGITDIEKWTRQNVYLDGKFIGRALNETCIGENMDFSKMAKYNITTNNQQEGRVTDYNENSGLIIVTGCGSTGWPSAFKPYQRTSELFSFTIILPVVGRVNSGEFSSCSLTYKNHNGKFAIDTVRYDFPRDSVLEIKLSESPLKVVVPKV